MKTQTKMNVARNVSGLDRYLQILHLEDDLNDRRLIQEWLCQQEIAAEITGVDNEPDFIEALEHNVFDLVLSDKSLPGFDGLTALRFMRVAHPNIPFVFVSGSMGEEAAIETMREGAVDYVLKSRLSRLVPAVLRAVREAEQKAKNRQIEEKNREQAALLDVSQDAIIMIDIKDRIRFWNKGAEKIYGWPADGVIGRKATVLLPIDAGKYQEAKQTVLTKGKWAGEWTAENSSDDNLVVESRWTLVRDEFGQPKRILITDTDITEKKAYETKFLRSQRMDSIGALAGGIAHDLNNALAPIIMSSELLKSSWDEDSRTKFLGIIHSSAHRATELVRQILGFARGSDGQRGPVCLRPFLGEISKMIQDTFPKSISFSVKFPEKELWTVVGDATEMHQVLLNLCVNARDAMPQGGELTLSAGNFILDEGTTTARGVKPGPYVMISVSDTGCGIPAEALPHIFEPFFTTKSRDKGTGLGLSTVASIVKHHGGFIDTRTQTGKGTEFKVYFPAVGVIRTEESRPVEVTLPTGRGELILVIDDEETVLELTKTTLENYGYQVMTASNGLQGIARFRENQEKIKLLVTDTDMPHLDGLGAVRAIKELKPDVPVIVASGSKRTAEELEQINAMRLKNLGKPYSLEQLLVAVDMGLH